MRYFLTGASGFIGGVLSRELVRAGHEVRALVRSPARSAALAALGVSLFEGDVQHKETMRVPMSGVDGVFHVAGWYKIGVRDRAAAEGTNVLGTRHVLELMRETGVARGVYTSTIAVNSDTHGALVDETYQFRGRHISLYDETKAQAHAIARAAIAEGLPLVIVQPGVVYGAGDTSSIGTTLRRYLRRELPLLPEGTAFSWGHVDDIARGHILAMERGAIGRSYFLTGPAHTLVDALDLAEAITGVPAPRWRVHPRWIRAAAAVVGLVDRVMTLPPEYTAEGLRVIAGTTYIGSSARARAEIGWSVRPLRDGLTETLEFERAHL